MVVVELLHHQVPVADWSPRPLYSFNDVGEQQSKFPCPVSVWMEKSAQCPTNSNQLHTGADLWTWLTALQFYPEASMSVIKEHLANACCNAEVLCLE
jgi:hypothetical protein